MTSHEQRRFRMRASLGEQLGDEVAEDLMDSLPPFDWKQIATKDDIRRLEARLDGMDHRFVSIDQRFEVIDKRFDLVDTRFDLLKARLEAKMLHLSVGSTVVTISALTGFMVLLR